MPKTRSPYPPEFKRQMIELVRAGRIPRELAHEFEPCYETIRAWVQQTDRDEGRSASGLSSNEREELRRLRRETRSSPGAGDLGKSSSLVRSGGRLGTTKVYEFVSAHQDQYPIATICAGGLHPRVLRAAHPWIVKAEAAGHDTACTD